VRTRTGILLNPPTRSRSKFGFRANRARMFAIELAGRVGATSSPSPKEVAGAAALSGVIRPRRGDGNAGRARAGIGGNLLRQGHGRLPPAGLRQGLDVIPRGRKKKKKRKKAARAQKRSWARQPSCKASGQIIAQPPKRRGAADRARSATSALMIRIRRLVRKRRPAGHTRPDPDATRGSETNTSIPPSPYPKGIDKKWIEQLPNTKKNNGN